MNATGVTQMVIGSLSNTVMLTPTVGNSTFGIAEPVFLLFLLPNQEC